MQHIDDPEDPRLLKIHAQRIARRDIDQLLGICEFALQDGHVDQNEAEAIHSWLRSHHSILNTWPANVLYDRLQAMLADGVIDQNEQRDLLDIVMQIARPKPAEGTQRATTLPLNTPTPLIEFPNHSFCLTGVFDFGSRSQCQRAIESAGGINASGITKKLDYLVIGNVGSEHWRHSSFGAKIAKAVEYRDIGIPIAIVSEDHWTKQLALL